MKLEGEDRLKRTLFRPRRAVCNHHNELSSGGGHIRFGRKRRVWLVIALHHTPWAAIGLLQKMLSLSSPSTGINASGSLQVLTIPTSGMYRVGENCSYHPSVMRGNF